MVGTSAISILEESTNPEAQNQVSVDKVAVILHTVRDTAPGEVCDPRSLLTCPRLILCHSGRF